MAVSGRRLEHPQVGHWTLMGLSTSPTPGPLLYSRISVWSSSISLLCGCLISFGIIISYDFDNITSTKWPEDDEDIPTYTLEFFDGWQAPAVSEVCTVPGPREPVSRKESPQPAPSQVNLHIKQ